MDKKVDVCAELKTRLPDLPRIMRAHNWTRGADLMEEWLTRGYNDNSDNDPSPNTHTITMEWVLSFARAQRVYLSGKNNAVWVNDEAKKQIVKKLLNLKSCIPKKVGERLEFGNVGKDIPPGGMIQFHKDWQIQYREVMQALSAYEYDGLVWVDDTLDDLYAALGNFNFYYFVKGWVDRLQDQDGKPRYKVTITKVGVYMRDSYDFKDRNAIERVVSQVLGIWGCEENYIGRKPWKGRYIVQNKDFIEWRAKYGDGRGGDFMVFSDIKTFDHYSTFEF